MKIINKLVIIIFFLGSVFYGCATVPTQPTRPDIWPNEQGTKRIYYIPQKMASAAEAVGTIKNLQNEFVEWGAGINFSSIDVDPYGLRAKWEWTETSQQTEYVPSYGGMFIGWNYIPIYSGSYQTKTFTQQERDMFALPFNEIEDIELLHMPYLDRSFKWGLIIRLKDNKIVNLRVSNERNLLQLSNAIASLAMERGIKLKKYYFGCVVTELSPAQSKDLEIPHGTGLLVIDLHKNSPAENSGIRFLDVLLEFDNTQLKKGTDLGSSIVKAYNSGKKVVPLKILRREAVIHRVVDVKTGNELSREVIEQKIKIIEGNVNIR